MEYGCVQMVYNTINGEGVLAKKYQASAFVYEQKAQGECLILCHVLRHLRQ